MKAMAILLCAFGLGCATSSSAKQPARGSEESWESVRERSRPAPDPSLETADAVHDTQAEREHAAPIRAPGPVSEQTRTPDSKAIDATTTAPPSAASASEADNTGVNKRDRQDKALTPMDQGEGPEDLRITKEIRQAVVGDSSLSFTAKNVKIITVNGKVTLRGPVGSESERTNVETAARRVAGAKQVDNQLEVKR